VVSLSTPDVPCCAGIGRLTPVKRTICASNAARHLKLEVS
jgi:hypothetical protein